MLPAEILAKYQRAGAIAAKVRGTMKGITCEGMQLSQICETAEETIKKLGGHPAFPCNVSVNDVAAHYTSPPGDMSIVPEGSLVKIDIGVHVDGYIADTAVTVCFDQEAQRMVDAAEEALETAVKIIRPGMFTSRLGSEVQRVIEKHGFKPISNLTGHKIGRYMIHAGESLPNISHPSVNRVQPGEVYAIEPFVTLKEATGRVEEGSESYIFRFVKHRSIKANEANRLLRFIETNFKTLPFAERWLRKYGSVQQYKSAFLELLDSRCLTSYPVFVEATGQKVAQAEHTVYIDKNEAIVLT